MLKNIANTFVTRIIIAALNLLLAIIISNVLGTEGRGEQGLILSTITIISLVTAIVGAGSITFFTPRIANNALLKVSYLWNLLICVFVLLFSSIQTILPPNYFIHIGLLVFILTGTQIHTGLLLGKEKIAKANSIQLISTLLIICSVVIIFFLYGIKEIKVYLYSLYIGYLISFIYSLVILKTEIENNRKESYPILEVAKRVANYGFLNQLDVIAQMLSFRFSYYVISDLCGISELGIYSNAVSVIESIWLISRSISMVLHSRVVNVSDDLYAKKITINFIKLSSLAVLIAIFVLSIVPASFYPLIFGEGFIKVKIVILTFLPGVLVFNTSFIFSGFFAGRGKYKYNVIASVVGLLLTLILAFTLIPYYGIIGAGITASISYVGTTVMKYYFFSRKYNLRFSDFLITKSDYNMFLRHLKVNL